MQDLSYQIWRTAERFDVSRGSLAGWLVVAARNRTISKLRNKGDKAEELQDNRVDLRTVPLRDGAEEVIFICA